jgi:cytochrome c553
MKIMQTVLLSLLLATGVAHAGGDAAAGKTKSVTCQACHGADGNSVNPVWPKLAGQHADYLARQLAAFKSGARKDPTMSAMAMPLTEADIADVSAYYASQVIKVETVDAAKVIDGEKLFRGGNKAKQLPACMSCHGPSGAGNPAAGYPALGGQHAAYTTKALQDYRSGIRGVGKDARGVMMQDIAAKMSDEEIAAVSGYIAGLH